MSDPAYAADRWWRREPTLILGAIRAAVTAAVAFGLDFTPEQIGGTILVAEAVLSLIHRSSVYAPATLDELTRPDS